MMKNGLRQPTTNFHLDRGQKRGAVTLLPGEYCVTNRDSLIVTAPGSCVTWCIRDPLGIAAEKAGEVELSG